MSLMGIREYGRHRNVSHVAVLKAVRAGRIRQNADGLIDSDRADRDWATNTHPAPRAPRALSVAVTDDAGFSRARGVREHFEALLAKLEYKKRSSDLLNADEVKIASHRTEQAFRKHMLSVPDAFVSWLKHHIREYGAAPTEHEVHVTLMTEIRAALERFLR
jgi:hypothetical protein